MPQSLDSYSDADLAQAEATFRRSYPSFAATQILDELRTTDYGRLDAQRQIYLDYTGGGLYAAAQIRQHMELLNGQVFGNPHSHNPTSLAMTRLVEQARDYVLEFFCAPRDEYEVVFTPNASGALKLIGEAFPFQPGDRYVLTADNHNSVNGIREFARRRGASVTYVPVTAPELRLDEAALAAALASARPQGRNLLAYPAQSNFSGVQHGLEWVERAQAQGWQVLLDAAAFAPTNRLDLSTVQPDFVCLSFYKICGYPTGVGALIARKRALAGLRRPWFAGGTISIASVQGDGFFLVEGGAAFEDGTVNYLNLPAVAIGLRHIAGIGIDTIHERVTCLTGWLIEQLTALRHSDGRPLVRLHGPASTAGRGSTLTFTLIDSDGQVVNDRRIEELAGAIGISLRTGCFCNPGAGEVAHGLAAQDLRPIFEAGRPLSFVELYDLMLAQGKGLSTVRISTGLATTFADVYRFMQFAAGFRDRSASDIGLPQPTPAHGLAIRDTA